MGNTLYAVELTPIKLAKSQTQGMQKSVADSPLNRADVVCYLFLFCLGQGEFEARDADNTIVNKILTGLLS